MGVSDTLKQLRDDTGVSIMQCKKALEEAGGDIEKAKIILRKQSSTIASKKSDRSLGAGVAAAYTHAGGGVGQGLLLGDAGGQRLGPGLRLLPLPRRRGQPH